MHQLQAGHLHFFLLHGTIQSQVLLLCGPTLNLDKNSIGNVKPSHREATLCTAASPMREYSVWWLISCESDVVQHKLLPCGLRKIRQIIWIPLPKTQPVGIRAKFTTFSPQYYIEMVTLGILRNSCVYGVQYVGLLHRIFSPPKKYWSLEVVRSRKGYSGILCS